MGESPDHFHRLRFSSEKICRMVLFGFGLNIWNDRMCEPFRFWSVAGGQYRAPTPHKIFCDKWPSVMQLCECGSSFISFL